jgi:uncharacterized protein YjbI with pentapeptide repeats
LSGADLRNADLSNADLQGANFRFADLRGANLFQTNLSESDLRYTLMQQVNTRAIFDEDNVRRELLDDLLASANDLTEVGNRFATIAIVQAWAYSSRTNFAAADLRFANLSQSDLSFSDFNGSILLDADFSGANLYMANMSNAIVVEDLSEVIVTGEFQYTGFPPVFDNQTLYPHWLAYSTTLDDLINPSSDMNTIIRACREFVIQLDAIEQTVPYLDCGIINVTIPYPARLNGPYRAEAPTEEDIRDVIREELRRVVEGN